EALQLKEGEKAELTLIISPEDAEITQLIWSSDNEAAVTVKASEDGKSAEVTAVKAGTAKIDVVAENGASASCTVEVSKTVDYGKTPRVITEKDGSIVVYVDNKPVSDYTGIAILGTEENAPWVYMENGQRNQKYTGYVDYDGSKFYVSGGTLDTGLNGVMIDPHSDPLVWYFNSNGQVQTQHVGLALYDGEWFYIENGKVATGMNAFVSYDGGLFAVGAGRIISEYSGLMQDPENTQTGDWYFFSKGQAQTQYSGLTKYDGHWFYVENGKFDPAYNGTVWYDGAQFEVVNGEAVVE
ncbi:MAG: Ig-like domain-containing protein, partial [Lachnospiraceae bacterium]|nr:Ig-like domain-containing protein [Lachnospiraceae bacterium]